MQTDLQLIQLAIASEDLTKENVHRMHSKDARLINLYAVTLPEKFKGLHSIWFFGILPELENIIKEDEIIVEASTLIQGLIDAKDTPVVFLSNEKGINFGDELDFRDHPIFFLTRIDIQGGREIFSRNAREAPFLLAAKKKFKTIQYTLSPYLPNKPVSDWQFFGRKKEVKSIMTSSSNFFIIGSRRIGKTSLLHEVARQLRQRGEIVHIIDLQEKEQFKEVIDGIAKKVSYRHMIHAINKGKDTDYSYLAAIIRKLKGDSKRFVLLLDEIGNVISKNIEKDSWKFMGVLREMSHNNEIRVIASAFQEVVVKQIQNPQGPFVNFGETLKIHSFTRNEIDDLLIAPLHFWGLIRKRGELINIIKKNFGSHPLLLQYLGKKLFELTTENPDTYIDDIINNILEEDDIDFFASAVDDIFLNIESYLERYVYLKLCIDIDIETSDLSSVAVNQEKMHNILNEIGIQSDLDSREMLLDRLTLRGLLDQNEKNRVTYYIDGPIIYRYLKAYYYPIHAKLIAYRNEITIKKLSIDNL